MGTWQKVLLCSIHIKCLLMTSVVFGWSYEDSSSWGKKWRSSCGKTRQSPVNIVDSEVPSLKSHVGVGLLNFDNFTLPLEADLTNNGKTAKLTTDYHVAVSGTGYYIHSWYRLEEVNFHWGRTDESGSEHKIDGKSALMEVQLVHYNMKYDHFKTAKQMFDGVLVLSTLVDASTNVSLNSFWRNISYALSVIRTPGSKTKISNVMFRDYLPYNTDDFYLYKGSFTTPPCFETVTWVVFKERLKIPLEYLEGFRALIAVNSGEHPVTLASNIRPVQPLNSRTVLKTFQSPGSQDFHVSESTLETSPKHVIAALRFYQCHIPASVRLFVIIPEKDIAWKSENLTSDIIHRVPLDTKSQYGVTLEMHDHPKGLYKDKVHVTAKLGSRDIVNDFYEFRDCLKGLCSWPVVGKTKTCTRQLIDTDEKLSFTLFRQNKCDDVYEVMINKSNIIVFETTIMPRTRVKVSPTDKQFNKRLAGWYLQLSVKNTVVSSEAKLFLDIEGSVLSSRRLLMAGVYHNGPDCNSSGNNGTPGHVMLIIGVTVGLFVLLMVVLSVCLVWRNVRYIKKPNALIENMEVDTSV